MHSPQTSKQLPNIKNCVDACTGGGESVRVHARVRMHIILILMDMQENEWGKEVAHALVGADTCMGCRCALGSELCMHECTHVLYVFAYMCVVHVCGYASASMCAGACRVMRVRMHMHGAYGRCLRGRVCMQGHICTLVGAWAGGCVRGRVCELVRGLRKYVYVLGSGAHVCARRHAYACMCARGCACARGVYGRARPDLHV